MFWRWYRTRYVPLSLTTAVKERYLPFRGWTR